MKKITELIFDTEEFKGIGFKDISTEYRLTLRRSSLEECSEGVMYQVYSASVPDIVFDFPCEHYFYLVLEMPLDMLPSIYEAKIWAISKSLGEMIIRQYSSLSYDMRSALDMTHDEGSIMVSAGLCNGMSRAEIDRCAEL